MVLSAGTGTDVVIHHDREFSKDQAEPYDWPEGALEIANDPLRRWGYLVWSTGAPNDRIQFVLGVREASDLQRHVDLMKNIKSLKRQIILVPGHLPLLPGYAAPPDERARHGVVFEVGSQKVINEWYERLPEVCPGLRRFGNRELNSPPEAYPPTLVISLSHPDVKDIELQGLRIPMIIDVKAEIDPAFRSERKNEDLIEQVETYVAQHQKRQEAMRKRVRARSLD